MMCGLLVMVTVHVLSHTGVHGSPCQLCCDSETMQMYNDANDIRQPAQKFVDANNHLAYGSCVGE